MSLASDMRKVRYDLESLAGEFGIHPFTVSVLTRTTAGKAWDGTGDGAAYSTLVLKEGGNANPKVRWITPKMYMMGYPQDVELEVTLTAELVATFDQLDPTAAEVIWLVEGPGMGDHGAKFTVGHINTQSALTWKLGLKRISTGSEA
jgi:hypothetical protein